MTFQLRTQPIAEPETQPVVIDQTTPSIKYPPIVDYRNPMSDVIVNSPNYNVVVSVANVLEQQQVQLRLVMKLGQLVIYYMFTQPLPVN
jgi:hypothetical protein